MTLGSTTMVTISVLVAEISASEGGSERSGRASSGALDILDQVSNATGGEVIVRDGERTVVVYSSLGTALEAAVGMQQRMERRGRQLAAPLDLRVGLSNGDATVVAGAYGGAPVDEAALLCRQAAGGQIVATDMVRLLARRTGHRFDPLGEVFVDGWADPVATWTVVWERALAAPLAGLPTRLSGSTRTEVVGRRAEAKRLSDIQMAAAHGQGRRVILLAGEPGIGKTTLASELAHRAAEAGTTVLYGRCDEDLGVPYQPFAEALDGLLCEVSDPVLATLEGRHLGALARLVPQVRRRVPDLVVPPSTDADAERYRLFGAVSAVLTALAARSPLLMVLDDLHWTDKPTMLLLTHIMETLGDADVCILVTYRHRDLVPGHPLADRLDELQAAGGVEQLTLQGLDDDAVVALLESLAGHEMDADGIGLARDVRRETGGNPFFCTEVLRHLAETDVIAQVGGRWVAVGDLSMVGLPESVREVVGQRVQRLGEEIRRVLTLASVIGRDFDLSLLARLADRRDDPADREARLSSLLTTAVDAGIIAPLEGRGDRFTFTHALFQHTLYDQLSASRRARAHRRIAESLEADCGDRPGERIGELAHHWLAGARPVEAGKAAEFARLAGTVALDALAPDEAIRWFCEALAALERSEAPDAMQRLDIVIELGDAQRQAGEPGYRETLLGAADVAMRQGDTRRMVAAALANQRGMVSNIGSVDAERIASLEEAIRATGDDDTTTRSLLLASLTAELTFDQDLGRIRATAAEAEAIARRLGDDAVLLRVLNLTFLPLWVPDALEAILARTHEAITLAERVGDPVGRYHAAANRVQILASQGDRRGMEEAIAPAAALADEIGQPFMRWQVLYLRCLLALLAGDAEEADRLAAEGLEIGLASGQPDALVIYGANLINIRFHQDRVVEILPLVEQAVADYPGLPSFRAAQAMALCVCGRPHEALPLLRAAFEDDFHNDAYDYVWLTTTTLWAESAALLDDVPAAQRLYDRLAPFEAQGVTSGASFVGTCGMYLARLASVLGRQDEALALVARAHDQLEAIGAPFWRARNQIEWASLLLDRGAIGDAEHAQDLLDEARATATLHGCPGIARQADGLLRSRS